MKRGGLLLVLALASARMAHAGGINVSWNDCGNSGAMNESFACNTNTGNHTLVVSYEPNAPMPDMTGNIVVLDVQNTMPIPPWWQMFNGGSCRQTALTANANFAANTGCTNPWTEVYAGGIASYQVGFSAPNRARLILVFAMPEGVSVTPGNEYYSVKVLISNAKTVGASSCFGCESPGCIVVASVELDSSTPTSQTITTPLDRNAVTWQGSVPYGCIAVPVARKTWGQIKSLYR